ncbi:MAG: glycosyltransferase [Nitrospirae bacterium]|nr:glycosyltransferase [Nitrospirota bacterium]
MAYKILLSTTIENTLPLGRAFRDIGYDVLIFDATIKSKADRYLFRPANKMLWNLRLMDKGRSLGAESQHCNKNFRTNVVLKAVEEFKPDCVIFEIGFKPSYEGISILKNKVEKMAGWWTMTTNWMNIEERESRLYDAFFFFTEEFVQTAKDMGFNAFYLPHAVNDYDFKKTVMTDEERNALDCDIVFAGAWQRPRQQAINSIASAGFKMRLYGPKWFKHNLSNLSVLRSYNGNWLYGEKLIKQYNAAKIVLNINSWFTRKSYGINQRVFDVPACGAFLLTDYVKELESFFKVGEDIETYNSVEELLDTIHFYLKNDDIREAIRRNGYERAMKLPTWRDRAREIAKALCLPIPDGFNC